MCLPGCCLFLNRRLSWQSFYQVNWNSRRRPNGDLHAVAGFATAIPIALIALSGTLI